MASHFFYLSEFDERICYHPRNQKAGGHPMKYFEIQSHGCGVLNFQGD